MPQQQECLQTQKTSSQLTSQHIQISQQMRYSQQISTNPNMTSPPQTPNSVLMYSQYVNRKANQQMLMSCNMPRQIILQQMPQQIPQNMLQQLLQTTPSQTNNQFISYGPTQKLVWQQQPNVAMYNLWNNLQQKSIKFIIK
ncbi:21069_t:CDS:2 [Gigaspora margarita]|uniref:21069_t:CDS:1 n=1 Tax=Gigaspora margarita TaxID=4874 RepID=A0ABN7VSG5_GIGMA|nr:21069_t:CDS:2 [Gigaspora margarita]